MPAQSWIAALFSADHASEWISGIAGAGGAILGSLVTIAWTEWFNNRTERRNSRERVSAAAFSALHRLNQIYSDMLMTREHLAEGFMEAHTRALPHLALATRPMNRLNDSVSFPVEELRALLSIGGPELLNTVNAQDRGYNVVMDLMQSYRIERTAAMTGIESTELGDGGFISFKAEDLKRIAPQLAAFDEQLTKAHEFAEDIATEALTAIRLIITSEKRPLGPTFSVTTKSLDGHPIKISALPKKKRRWPVSPRPA